MQSVESISVGPHNVQCMKRIVQNVVKLRSKRLKRNGKRRSDLTFFPHIIYMLCKFPKITLMVHDTLDSSAHYVHFIFNLSFDISARM